MNKLFQRMTPHAAGQRGWGGRGLDITLHKNNEQPIPVAASISGHPLLGLRVRIPLGGMVVCLLCMLCLTGRAVCEGPVSRPEESFSVCVSPCV